MISKEYLSQLVAIAPNQILTNHNMAGHVSFNCSGTADYFSSPSDSQTFQKLLLTARQLSIPVFILGRGSNIIFRDQGFHGLVLSTAKLNHFELLENNLIRVGAGLSVADLTALTLDFALSGFEWASGLPGTIGGGLFMNARCYGSSFSSIAHKVTFIDEPGQLKTIAREACQFDYKQSVFQRHPWPIVEAFLQLKPGDISAIQSKNDYNLQDRLMKHQFEYPSAGCVFKNVYSMNLPAGQLIEQCGLKGRQIGGMRVFEHHANFIINTGQGTSSELEKLMFVIKNEVKAKTGILLEPEIRLIG